MKELQVRLNNDINEKVRNRICEYIPKSIADDFINRLNDEDKKLYIMNLLAKEYHQAFLLNSGSKKDISIANVVHKLNIARNILKEYYKRTVPSGFKLVPGYEDYAVDTAGNVIRVDTRCILKQTLNDEGYLKVVIRNKKNRARSITVHRLFMLTYIRWS